MGKSLRQAAQQAGLTTEDIDLFIPHQANIRIIETAARVANLPPEKVFVNIHKYGNTSAASIPIALDEAVRDNRLEKGKFVVFVAFGAGLTWGSCLARW